MVQSTTVELFQSRGIAVAPISVIADNPHPPSHFNLAGVVALSAPEGNGSLTLSLADAVFSLFSPPVMATAMVARDLLRELTNQLSGRIKNRLLNFKLLLTIGVPRVLSAQAFDHQRQRRATEVVYVFRTLRGELVVTLDLDVEPSSLDFSGTHKVAKEGDFIVF